MLTSYMHLLSYLNLKNCNKSFQELRKWEFRWDLNTLTWNKIHAFPKSLSKNWYKTEWEKGGEEALNYTHGQNRTPDS